MASKKFYAVKKGFTIGVFDTWDDCKNSVNGYSGAIYKSFSTREDAEKFLGGVDNTSNISNDLKSMDVIDKDMPYAFVDGSFNPSTLVYGFGGYVFYNGEKYIVQGHDNNQEMASMRNVAGEVLGSMAAIKKAMELGIKEIVIYYDYEGIRAWAVGDWKRNKVGTIAYYDFIQSVKNDISLHFVHVKGHTGVEGNEEADKLAKQSVGL